MSDAPTGMVRAMIGRAVRGMIRLSIPLALPLERRIVRRVQERATQQPDPLFIIGAPRSGSTLLYKVVTQAFQFGFVDNFSSWFWRTPLLGTMLSRWLRLAPGRSFDSRYGILEGLGDPSEFGAFWYRWFPEGLAVHAPSGSLPIAAVGELRRDVAAMGTAHGKPLVFKNLFNSMRVGVLAECFPHSLFVVCRRDPVQNALSLLKGRIENVGDKAAWWTLPPREVGTLLGRPYAEQVAGQVHYIQRQIESDMMAVGRERFHVVEYEAFCRDVHGHLRGLANFLARQGIPARLDLSGIPESFEAHHVTGLGEADEWAVTDAVAAFAGKSKPD
jgi:hypothetical protein